MLLLASTDAVAVGVQLGRLLQIPGIGNDIFYGAAPGSLMTPVIFDADKTSWAITIANATYRAGPVSPTVFFLRNSTFWFGTSWKKSPAIAQESVRESVALFGTGNSADQAAENERLIGTPTTAELPTAGGARPRRWIVAVVSVLAVALVAAAAAFAWLRFRPCHPATSVAASSKVQQDDCEEPLDATPAQSAPTSQRCRPALSSHPPEDLNATRAAAQPPPSSSIVETGGREEPAASVTGSVASVSVSGARASDTVSARSGHVRAVQAAVSDAVTNMQAQLQAELQDRHLQIHSVLGRGGFGTVYHGACLRRRRAQRLASFPSEHCVQHQRHDAWA
jgi:hypothetical protein